MYPILVFFSSFPNWLMFISVYACAFLSMFSMPPFDPLP